MRTGNNIANRTTLSG